MQRSPTRAELLGTRPVYLLTLSWDGIVYRLSTEPVDVVDGTTTLAYIGGIAEVPDVREETDRQGVSDDGPSVPLALYLDGTDIAQRIAEGRDFSLVTGELSMVLVRRANGVVQTAYKDRFWLAQGRLLQPVFGNPTQASSSLQVTLEQSPGDDNSTILDPEARISEATWPDAASDALGAPYPLVIGQPGLFRNAQGTLRQTSGSPAYPITYSGSNIDELLIADGQVAATTVDVTDSTGSFSTYNVIYKVDGLGRVVAAVNISGGGVSRTETQYWVSWPDGGGIENPFAAGTMRGLGDVISWALLRSSLPVDIKKWRSEAALLNRYKVDTYLNDDTTSPWRLVTDFLKVIPEVSVRWGRDGLYPQVRRLDYSNNDAVAVITEGPDFEGIDNMVTETALSDIINQFSVRFAPRAKDGFLRRTVTCTPTPDPDDNEQFSTYYAITSFNRWRAIQSGTVELAWVYDETTAALIASRMVRVFGFQYRQQPFLVDWSYGWLDVGQLIKLSSERLHEDERMYEIIGKRPLSNAWVILLPQDDDPLRLSQGT